MTVKSIFPQKVVTGAGNPGILSTLEKDPSASFSLSKKEFILFDFGMEYVGGVRIITGKCPKDAKIRIRLGESASEAMSELGEKGSCNDHSTRDLAVGVTADADETYAASAFRFVRIDCLSSESPIAIRSLTIRPQIDEREQIGSFECSDPLVNRIYETAARTIRYNLQNGYLWDGVKRDRLVWIGDLYPEALAAHTLFGDTPEIDASLSYAEYDAPMPNGWVDDFPTYSLWWMMILCRDYYYSGDKARFLSHLPFLKDTVAMVAPYVHDDGAVQLPRHFIDWPTHYEEGGDPVKKQEEDIGVSYLARMAFTETKAAFASLGLEIDGIDEICKKLLKFDIKPNKFKQIAALGVLSGMRDKDLCDMILAGGANGISTFMSYPIFRSLALFGKHDEALSFLREYYGGMLKVGATTFFEDFDLGWIEGACPIDRLPKPGEKDIHGDFGAFCYRGFRHSLCHGWSAGPVPYLAENVLGVRREGFGSDVYVIEPHLSDLIFAKGTVPTPLGPISVCHTKEPDGSVKTEFTAPSGITVRVEGGKTNA